jgi:putative FmdB family regulatory protein
MPKYDYKCPECGEKTEAQHRMGEIVLLRCIACGAIMKRVFNIIHFRITPTPSPAIKDHLDRVNEKREKRIERYGD